MLVEAATPIPANSGSGAGALTRSYGLRHEFITPHTPEHNRSPIPNSSLVRGLIPCAERNEAAARYSVLHESQQQFASRYRFTLPSEADLQRELLRERALIENHMDISAL